MDLFNKLYINLMEDLNSSILSPNNGATGGALTNTDSVRTGDNRNVTDPPIYVRRSGRIKRKKK